MNSNTHTHTYVGQVLVDPEGGGGGYRCSQSAAVRTAESLGIVMRQFGLLNEPELRSIHKDGRLMVATWNTNTAHMNIN